MCSATKLWFIQNDPRKTVYIGKSDQSLTVQKASQWACNIHFKTDVSVYSIWTGNDPPGFYQATVLHILFCLRIFNGRCGDLNLRPSECQVCALPLGCKLSLETPLTQGVPQWDTFNIQIQMVRLSLSYVLSLFPPNILFKLSDQILRYTLGVLVIA